MRRRVARLCDVGQRAINELDQIVDDGYVSTRDREILRAAIRHLAQVEERVTVDDPDELPTPWLNSPNTVLSPRQDSAAQTSNRVGYAAADTRNEASSGASPGVGAVPVEAAAELDGGEEEWPAEA